MVVPDNKKVKKKSELSSGRGYQYNILCYQPLVVFYQVKFKDQLAAWEKTGVEICFKLGDMSKNRAVG